MNKALMTWLACAIAALLAACGGGGDDGATDSDARAQAAASTRDTAGGARARAPARPRPAAPIYAYSDLGIPGQNSQARAINNHGQVVGFSSASRNPRYPDAISWEVVWWDGITATPLSTDGPIGVKTYGFPYGINDRGQVVGEGDLFGDRGRATLWTGGAETRLDMTGALPISEPLSNAYAINKHGQIVGRIGDVAALWNDGSSAPTLLDSALSSEARGINGAGQAVGRQLDGSGVTHATLWNGATATYLATLGGVRGDAFGINDAGEIVGNSDTGSGIAHATLWRGATVTDLGTLGGTSSAAGDVNNGGQIVGASLIAGDFAQHATLWTPGGTVIDLNRFLGATVQAAGWYLESAAAINEHGWIVGTARNDTLGEVHAYVLTPLTDKKQCKEGGWQSFGFANQGQCIRYVSLSK